MESHGSADADQGLINSKGGKSLVVQYESIIQTCCTTRRFEHYFPAANLLAHSVQYWCTDIQFVLPGESWSRQQRKICKEIITQREWSWRWGLEADTHNHRDKCSQWKCADAVVVPAMAEGSSRVKQMQSLWPEWMWHPLKCGLVLSLLPSSINLSLHCLLLLLPFCLCFFLLYLQSLSFLFGSSLLFNVFFSFCVSFLFLFDPRAKPLLGRHSRSPCWYGQVFSSVDMTPDLPQPSLYSLFPFSASALSDHTVRPRFIPEYQFLSVMGINRYRTEYS